MAPPFDLVAQGRAAWPELMLDDARLGEFLAARAPPGQAIERERLAELVLAFACSTRDLRALRIFEDRFLARVPEWVRRIDRNSAFAADVQGVLRERLLSGSPPRIAEFRGVGSLEGWLRVTAVRAALELARAARHEQLADEPARAASDWLDDPELEYLKLRYAGEFKQAVTESLESLPDRERALLGLYLADGLNIDRIGKLYGVHRATVARWIAAARELLHDGTEQRLAERLSLAPGDFESIVRLVQSQLDVSVRRILANPPSSGAK
jgi:RNA polymerase sigma-70 factor, ECF subfamily